jgi:hypothetical protein
VPKQNDRTVFDRLFRHQVYLEALKDGLASDFGSVVRDVLKHFHDTVSQLGVENFGDLSLFQLAKFLRAFNAKQNVTFDSYTGDLINTFEDFVDVELGMQNDIFDDEEDEPNSKPMFNVDSEDDDESKLLYGLIVKEPIPANGALLEDQVKGFSVKAQLALLALIRQAYANSWTVNQAVSALAGNRDVRFRDGLVATLANQNDALVNTSVQHLSANVQGQVSSTKSGQDIWVAVLDSKTTVICRSRDGRIYKRGEGPYPPAHFRCRSKRVPFVGEGFAVPVTFVEWLRDQSAEFQNDVLGLDKAEEFRTGLIDETDFSSVVTTKPLTLAQFASKIRFILGE